LRRRPPVQGRFAALLPSQSRCDAGSMRTRSAPPCAAQLHLLDGVRWVQPDSRRAQPRQPRCAAVAMSRPRCLVLSASRCAPQMAQVGSVFTRTMDWGSDTRSIARPSPPPPEKKNFCPPDWPARSPRGRCDKLNRAMAPCSGCRDIRRHARPPMVRSAGRHQGRRGGVTLNRSSAVPPGISKMAGDRPSVPVPLSEWCRALLPAWGAL